jgi:hypothetical protein
VIRPEQATGLGARTGVRDSNRANLVNLVTTLELFDSQFGSSESAIDTARSKRSEMPPVRGVLVILRKWLAVRDDFRNWLIHAA